MPQPNSCHILPSPPFGRPKGGVETAAVEMAGNGDVVADHAGSSQFISVQGETCAAPHWCRKSRSGNSCHGVGERVICWHPGRRRGESGRPARSVPVPAGRHCSRPAGRRRQMRSGRVWVCRLSALSSTWRTSFSVTSRRRQGWAKRWSALRFRPDWRVQPVGEFAGQGFGLCAALSLFQPA